MATNDEGTFEMLWDCGACGTPRLLGLSQRFCPNCGSAQDPARRYFPSDADKVAVTGHEYVGADRVCPYCRAPQSAKGTHCTACGGPLDGSRAAVQREDAVRDAEAEGFAGETVADARRADKERKDPQRKDQDQSRDRQTPGSAGAPPAGGRRWIAWAVAAGVAVVGLVAFALMSRPAGTLVVRGHAWQRVIHVEQLGPQPDSAWCDQLPLGALSVTRTREVREHRSVQKGEDCQVRRHDNGDGTFAQKRECRPKMVDEPVYGERCHYVVERWHPARELTARGGIADPPAWPDATSLRGGTCIGCEREGGRAETYTVTLVEEPGGRSHACDTTAARFAEMEEGSRWTGRTGVLAGDLRCDTLTRR